MAQPIQSYPNMYPPQPTGTEGMIKGGGFIPNGQPTQFGRPPVYPEKVARPMIGQQAPLAHPMPTNGNQQYSHPSSLSSHSSRDPSPVPYQRSPAASDNLSNSSPVMSSPNRPPSSSQLHHGSVQSTPTATPPPAPSPQNNHQPRPGPHQVVAHPAASQSRPPQVDPDPAAGSNGRVGPPMVGPYPQAGGPYRPQGPPGPLQLATEFPQQQRPYVAPQTAPNNPQLTHLRQQMAPTSPISVNTSSAATQNAQSEQNRQQYNPQSQSELNRPRQQNVPQSQSELNRQQNVTQSQTELNRQQYLPQSQSELNRQPNIPQSQLSGLQQAPSLSQSGQYGQSVPPSAARTAFNPPQTGPPRFGAPFQGQTYPNPNIPASSDQSARSNQQNSSAGQANQTVPSGSSGAGVAYGSDRYHAQPTGQQGVPAQGQLPGGAPVRTNALGTLPRPEPAQLAYPETTAAGFTSQPSVLSQLQLIGTQTQSRMSSYVQPPHSMQNGPTSGLPPHAAGMPPSQAASFPPQSRVAPAPPGMGPAPGIRPPPPSGMGSATGVKPPGTGPPTGMRPMGTGPSSGMGPPTGMGPSPGMGPHPSGMGPPSSGTGYPPSGMGTPPTGMGPPNRMGPPPSGMGPPPMGMGPPPSGMGPPPMGMGPPPMGMGPPPMGMGPPPTGPHPPAGPPSMPPGSYPPPGAVPHQYGQPHASQPDAGHLPKRYPQQTSYSSSMQPNPAVDANFNQQLAGLSVAQTGFSKLWGADSYDLLQTRNILPAEKVEMPRVKLQQEFLDAVNCSPEIFRCTMTKIPETNSLLQKSRLPLGILIHPFKDLNHLAVIQCQSIVRCRACRTYINPFVYFVDHKRWKCNLCFRVNELPEEFQFDPVSKTYGDPSRRPEIRSATIEFIAPSEYMLRPPQPAVYLFLLDVSCLATECGYLRSACDVLLDELDRLPGDGRTQCGFVTYDSAVHFYNLTEGLNQPQQMVVVDVNDIFLPCPFSLVVNLNESKELIRDLLKDLPKRFAESHDSHSALGAALQAAYKLMAPTGGRITVFQACLPNLGPGALASREDPSARANKEVPHLNPATDFYKRLALDCSGQQVAVDLFVVNQQYCDLATLSGISRFSGGSIHHFPLFKANDPLKADAFEQAFRRYLTRKLGLEAVMRIRCSRGLAIHTFHGNFFVRSTDLLSLPNVNPDAGFGMQVSVEESLSDLQNVCFQAALLYTSSKGERRIRVHTLCLPVAANLSDILQSADQQCIVGLLAKMAVDRSLQSSLSDAREAFVNVAVDILSAYKVAQSGGGSTALLAPFNLRLLPVYILALLKYVAFRTGQSTRLDDRVFAMCQMKTLPLATLIQEIYPDLYPVHTLSAQPSIDVEGTVVPQPPRLQLTAEKLEAGGAFLLDGGDHMILFVGRSVNTTFCQAIFGVHTYQEISERLHDLPEIDTPESESLRNFVNYLQMEKSCPATLQIIRDDSQHRQKFYDRLLEDRTESSLSYYEFLQHLKTNVK